MFGNFLPRKLKKREPKAKASLWVIQEPGRRPCITLSFYTTAEEVKQDWPGYDVLGYFDALKIPIDTRPLTGPLTIGD